MRAEASSLLMTHAALLLHACNKPMQQDDLQYWARGLAQYRQAGPAGGRAMLWLTAEENVQSLGLAYPALEGHASVKHHGRL